MSNARFSILQARAIGDIRISDAQFRTLAALGMYADKNGWCFPSLKTLGIDLNKSPQAVGRDTIALRKLGYLQVRNRYDSKTKARHSNMYRLLFDFNVDDSTLSTSEVDTLSTPEVDVNDPINDPIKPFSFSAKDKEQNDAKMNYILANSRQSESPTAWRGRELLGDNYLAYGDWWHSKTGLHMYGAKAKAKVDTEWLNAFKAWYEFEITIPALDEAYQANEWRKVSKPSQITADAKLVQAAPKKTESTIPVTYNAEGMPESW